MTQDHGRSGADAPSGYSAEPEPCSTVSAVPASIPNADGIRLAEFTDEYREQVCKMGQGASCCRYLTMGRGGFECAKRTSLRFGIDSRVGRMNAKGDNCGGAFDFQPQFVLLREHFGHPAGTIIYRCKGYDYGLASDDARATGKPHTSMTLEPSGDYPSFTVADEDYAPASAIEARRAAATQIDAVADESAASEAGDAQ